jgi:hypothetical protein
VVVAVAVTATPSTLDTAALLARDRRLVDRWFNVDGDDGPLPLPVAFFAHDTSTRSALRTVAASAAAAAALGGACGVVCFDATCPVYAHIEAQLSRLVTQLGADVVVVCVALHPPPSSSAAATTVARWRSVSRADSAAQRSTWTSIVLPCHQVLLTTCPPRAHRQYVFSHHLTF